MTSWAGLLLIAASLWAMLALVLGPAADGDARMRAAFVLVWGLGALAVLWLAHRSPGARRR